MARLLHWKTSSLWLVVFLLFIALFSSCARKAETPEKPPEVVVWTYDSFNSEWAPGPGLTQRFLADTGIAIRWVSHGDAGTMLARLLMEEDAQGDIILGLDQNMAERALGTGLLSAYKPQGWETILPELAADPQGPLVPFDYGYFAIVYDSEAIPNPPKRLEDLTKPEFQGKLILMDPRTSSPGLGFFGWTQEIYGELWRDYWRRLKPSILTIADGWDAGYGLFTAGEAPMVLSYTTSPGVHLEYEGTERYQAAIFTEGHPLQVEFAGILEGAANRENAEKFMDYMLTPAFQDLIPLTNWMYPVTPIELPDSFRINPKSDKPLRPAPPDEAALNEWALIMSQR